MDDFEWPDMPFESFPQDTLEYVDEDYGESHFTTETFYDYLKFCHENGYHKLSGIITNKQRIFNIAKSGDHWSLEEEIFAKVFPQREYDWGNYYEDGIAVFSVGDDLAVQLPEHVTQIQYESLLKIIDQVHQFEKDFDTSLYNFDAEYYLKDAKARLSTMQPYDLDEVIVGIPLTEELPKELFDEAESKKEDAWSMPDDDSDKTPFFGDEEVQIDEYVEVDKNNENEIQEFVEITDLEKQKQEEVSQMHFR